MLNTDAATNVDNISSTGGALYSRTSTAADLPEPSKGSGVAISISSGAADDHVEFDTTNIDDADGGRIGSTVFSYKTKSGYTSGDFKAVAYSVTNSRVISEYSIPAGSDTVPFDTAMTSEEDIRVRFVSTVTDSVGLVVSGVKLEPASERPGALIGKWKDFTPVFENSPTWTVNLARYKINGSNLEIKVQATVDSTTGSGTALYMLLPDGYTLDSESISSSNSLTAGYGSYVDLSQTTGARFRDLSPVATTAFSDKIRFYRTDGSAPESIAGNLFAVGDQIGFTAVVPVAELANASTPLLSDVQYENAAITAINESGTSYTANTPIPWDSATVLAPGITFDGTDTFTALVKMKVSIPFMRLRSTTITSLSINVTDTSGTVLTGGEKVIASGSETRHQGGGLLELDAGQEFQFRANNSFTMSSVADENVIKMFRVSDYSARAAGMPIASSNSDGNYVSVPYWTETKALDSDWNSGSAYIERVGNIVTITVSGGWSGSKSSIATSTSFLPDWALPIRNSRNICGQLTNMLGRLDVNTSGSLSLNWLNDTLNGSESTTDPGHDFNVSYRVN